MLWRPFGCIVLWWKDRVEQSRGAGVPCITTPRNIFSNFTLEYALTRDFSWNVLRPSKTFSAKSKCFLHFTCSPPLQPIIGWKLNTSIGLLHPRWNFQHRMEGHLPGINHHSVTGRFVPKIWPWVQSFCRPVNFEPSKKKYLRHAANTICYIDRAACRPNCHGKSLLQVGIWR